MTTFMSPANWLRSRIPCDAFRSMRAAKVAQLMPDCRAASCQQQCSGHLE